MGGGGVGEGVKNTSSPISGLALPNKEFLKVKTLSK